MSAKTFLTLRGHLKKLPEPFRSQAIANTDKGALRHKAARTLADAVYCAFAWDITPEGYDYWHDLTLRLAESAKGGAK